MATTPEAAYDALLAGSATRAERGLCVVRAIFCVGVMTRSLLINARPETVPPVVVLTSCAIAFSLWALWRLRSRPASIGLLTASVAVDLVVCFGCLSVNVIWPDPPYPGLLRLPELATVGGIIVASGFRGHPRLAVVSMTFACLLTSGMAALDLLWNEAMITYNSSDLVSLLLLYTTIGALGALTGRSTRRMLQQMGRLTWRGERAEGSIERLLHEQHDMQAVLSAALIHAQLLSREAKSPTLGHLVADLEVLRASTGAMRDLADAELLALKAPVRTDLAAFIRATADRLGHLAPQTQLDTVLPDGPAWAVLAGGRLSALRIFANLIKNAAEGDGERGARHITLRIQADGARTRVRIEDDGPGFADTRKAGGTGVGLASVENLVQASGGGFERRNAAHGGAIVEFWLPADGPAG